MTDTMVTAGMRAAATVVDQTEFSRTGEVLRDIARGGRRHAGRVYVAPPHHPRAWGAVLIC